MSGHEEVKSITHDELLSMSPELETGLVVIAGSDEDGAGYLSGIDERDGKIWLSLDHYSHYMKPLYVYFLPSECEIYVTADGEVRIKEGDCLVTIDPNIREPTAA